MSPSVSVQLRQEHSVTPIITANSNAQVKTRKPRRRAPKNPLPPLDVRDIAQKLQAADEHWQELIEAHNKRLQNNCKSNDLLMVAAFSCVVHSLFDDKDLCGRILTDFVTKLGKERSLTGNIFHG
jgi:hypothetical protein